jgi:hypothetical protein
VKLSKTVGIKQRSRVVVGVQHSNKFACLSVKTHLEKMMCVLVDREKSNAVLRKGRGFVLLATDIATSFKMLLF